MAMLSRMLAVRDSDSTSRSVLGDVAEVFPHGHGLAGDPDTAAGHDLAAVRSDRAEEDLAQRVHAAVAQAADAHDLALAEGDAYILKRLAEADISQLHGHLVPMGRSEVAAVVVALQLPPDHAGADLIGVELVLGKMADDRTVPQDGQRVADLHDLFQVVGDEEYRFPLVPEPFHQIVEDLTSLLAERRRGLVHDQDLGILHHDLGDLHELSRLEVKRCHGRRARDILNADGPQRLVRFGVHRLTVDAAEGAGELLRLAQEHVFRHGHALNGTALLHDHADAARERLDHAAGRPGLAVIEHLTGIGLLHAGRNGRDGGLAGAVFTDQSADLTGVDVQIHIAQRHGTGEGFADVLHFQDGSFHRLTSCISLYRRNIKRAIDGLFCFP